MLYIYGWAVVLILVCGNVYGQQTLAGFGSGGLDGNGFGDPVKNDYIGIDWGYDFQAGMIAGRYNPYAAKQYADRMRKMNEQRYKNPYSQDHHPMSKFKELERNLHQKYPFIKK